MKFDPAEIGQLISDEAKLTKKISALDEKRNKIRDKIYGTLGSAGRGANRMAIFDAMRYRPDGCQMDDVPFIVSQHRIMTWSRSSLLEDLPRVWRSWKSLGIIVKVDGTHRMFRLHDAFVQQR